MKITKFLIAFPVFAMMGISPANAQSSMDRMEQPSNQMPMEKPAPGNNPDTPDMPEMTTEDIKKGWQDTKEAAQETYEKIRAALIDEDTELSQMAYVEIDSRMTAEGMINEPVYNVEGETVGHIDDIILNNNGRAETVVIRHGGFMGIGSKRVAFNYDQIMKRAENGDMVMAVSMERIENAVPYAYDQADADQDRDMQIMPLGNYRVSKLLDSDVSSSQGQIVARADNIQFRNGMADRLIISFNGAYGVGGELASMEYDKLSLLKMPEDEYQYRMSYRQSRQFEEFKKKKASY